MSKSKDSRRQFTTKQTIDTLRKQMADEVPVSDPCDEAKLQRTVFYRWGNPDRLLGSPPYTRHGGRLRVDPMCRDPLLEWLGPLLPSVELTPRGIQLRGAL